MGNVAHDVPLVSGTPCMVRTRVLPTRSRLQLLIVIVNSFYEAQMHLADEIVKQAFANTNARRSGLLELEDFFVRVWCADGCIDCSNLICVSKFTPSEFSMAQKRPFRSRSKIFVANRASTSGTILSRCISMPASDAFAGRSECSRSKPSMVIRDRQHPAVNESVSRQLNRHRSSGRSKTRGTNKEREGKDSAGRRG